MFDEKSEEKVAIFFEKLREMVTTLIDETGKSQSGSMNIHIFPMITTALLIHVVSINQSLLCTATNFDDISPKVLPSIIARLEEIWNKSMDMAVNINEMMAQKYPK